MSFGFSLLIWIGIGVFLFIEGIIPLLFPRAWRRYMECAAKLSDNQLRRVGGGFVVAGVVIVFMLLHGLK